MPLSLIVAGLSHAEKTALAQALTSGASRLLTSWTFFWDSSEFPLNPDALLYFPHHTEGQFWFQRLKKQKDVLMITALKETDSTPSDFPLFLRMPFQPSFVIDVLNLAAQRLHLRIPDDPLSSFHPSTLEMPIPLDASLQGYSATSSWIKHLYTVFQLAQPQGFYKIRAYPLLHDPSYFEIWCWPDLDYYWSTLSESELLSLPALTRFDIHHAHGKKEQLQACLPSLRPARSLLWNSGFHSASSHTLFPWISSSAPFTLKRWPILSPEYRQTPLLETLHFLNQSSFSFAQLQSYYRSSSHLTRLFNALSLSGDLLSTTLPPPPKKSSKDPEQLLFERALLHLSQKRVNSVSSTSSRFL